MFKWLHHLFNPHCESCFLEEQRLLEFESRKDSCRTCEVLEMTNAELRADNQRLLEIVLKGEERIEYKQEPQQFNPIKTMPTLWKHRRASLELADKMRAEEIKAAERAMQDKAIELKSSKTTEDLEKNMDVVIPNA